MLDLLLPANYLPQLMDGFSCIHSRQNAPDPWTFAAQQGVRNYSLLINEPTVVYSEEAGLILNGSRIGESADPVWGSFE